MMQYPSIQSCLVFYLPEISGRYFKDVEGGSFALRSGECMLAIRRLGPDRAFPLREVHWSMCVLALSTFSPSWRKRATAGRSSQTVKDSRARNTVGC